MSFPKPLEMKFSYKDYVTWPDDERWEIIDGVPYNMTPAPVVKHQKIVGKLHSKLVDRAEEDGCTLLIAPTDVIFDDYNVVQPDVLMVCDQGRISRENIRGAPDLIIEVLSPSTSLKDRREKKRLYERFGVREYILIYPEDELVERFLLEGSSYQTPDIFNWDESMEIRTLGLEVSLWEIFGKRLDESPVTESRPVS
jgi:Uma2 family endonuclease